MDDKKSSLHLAPVTVLPVVTVLPLDPERVLNAASEQKFERILLIGITADGEFYFSSSQSDGGTCMWDMEQAKLKLLGVL